MGGTHGAGTLPPAPLKGADAAVVHKTDVHAAGDKVAGVEFPESAEAINDYPITPLMDAAKACPPPSAGRSAWPADARYCLTTSDKRTLYAQSLDLATGLGPPRIQQAAGDQLAGRTFVDPDTGHQVVFGPVGDVRILDPQGEPYTGRLPANASWLLGAPNVDGEPGKLSEPFLLDPQGRPTERRVIDPESRYPVDPDTRVTYAPDGAPIDPAGLDPALRARLGFRAEGYRAPRFVVDPDSSYSVHPMTGAVALSGSVEPVERTTVPPRTLVRLDALVRAHPE